MSIPETLVAVLKPQHDYRRSHTDDIVTCRPAFLVPTGSKLLTTAREWGSGSSRWHTPNPPHHYWEETDIPNTPLESLRLVGISKRSEGGLAYKVVDHRGWLTDWREDEFLYALMNGHINAEGYISGDYVWGKHGNQMRLVRVDSALYERMKTAGERSQRMAGKKKIRAGDLVVGNVYESSTMRAIYLGRVTVRFPACRNILGRGEGRKATKKKLFAWRILENGGLKDKGDDVTLTSSYVYKVDAGPAEEPFEVPARPVWWYEYQKLEDHRPGTGYLSYEGVPDIVEGL